jgi:hypothetical protein
MTFLGTNAAHAKKLRITANSFAHRIGSARPALTKPGNYILVCDDKGNKVFEAPIG